MLLRKHVLLAVCSTAIFAAACTEALKTPAEPTEPGTTSTLKVTAPTLKDPVNDARLASVPPTLNASESTFTSGTPSALQYRFELLKADGTTLVEQSSLKSSPAGWVPAETLADNTKYTWRVRAEKSATEFGPWSALGSFLTPVSSALFNDPLTNGVTVATVQRGGTFVPGAGWQSNSRIDALDYVVNSCASCTVEFDATNFGKKEGEAYAADLKWISMGDNATFFGGVDDIGYNFRDHDWKMHLEQRADNDGTGMKIVWRNGAGGGGNPGDHSNRFDSGGPNWNSGQVFHFKIQWNAQGFVIQVDGATMFEDGFDGKIYEPPHHVIQLGCTPRGESFVGIIYRNVRITKQ